MKNSYKFLTSVKGPIKEEKNKHKIMDALYVNVYAENKKEALKKVKKVAETKYCYLQEINECSIDMDKLDKRQNRAFDMQEKAFDWIKKKFKIK